MRKKNLLSLSIPLLIAVAVLAFLVPHLVKIQAAALNQNCTLIVPAVPLTATGLATPYQLQATNPADGPCNEANNLQAAFVQAGVYDPATKTVSIYNPLVIDAGATPAVAPVVPVLPPGSIVGIWFGFNGNNLTLRGTAGSLFAGRCVNGLGKSVFGQFAYCNALAFFAAALPNVVTPALGVSPVDGLPCPTVRDFSVVDQDQSDNVTTVYVVNATGQIAQNNAANAGMAVASLTNASDNRLLTKLDPVLGCAPFMAPDLTNPGTMTTGLPLDELSAAQHQAAPIARIPDGDPMVLVNGHPNILKRTLYRLGVIQNIVATGSTKIYCQNLMNIAPNRIFLDRPATQAATSPDAAVGNSLFTFIASRFETTFGPNGLNCTALLGKPVPITVIRNGDGVAVDATNTPNPATAPANKHKKEHHHHDDD